MKHEKLFTLLVALLLVLIMFSIEDFRIAFSPKMHTPYIAYTPYWFDDESENLKRTSFKQVKADLDLAKSLGFKGIKLWCIEGLEYNNLTEKVFDYCAEIGLEILLPLRVWRQEEFPNNNDAIRDFLNFLNILIPKIKDKKALRFYILHYPIDYSDIYGYAQTWFKTEKYRMKLQGIIMFIKQLDPKHKVYMALEFDPKFGAPYDLGVDGFGVEPYSWNTPYSFDPHKIIEYLRYFEDQGYYVFIDEYGLHTTKGVNHGYCINEETKTRILRDFIMFIYSKKYLWCYFSLFNTSEADWGLAYANGTLKQSGLMIRDLLRKVTI
ncbi:MAG: hypothetical protein QXM87_02875 [Candidatus Bathyarchaeia archaeon]